MLVGHDVHRVQHPHILESHCGVGHLHRIREVIKFFVVLIKIPEQLLVEV